MKMTNALLALSAGLFIALASCGNDPSSGSAATTESGKASAPMIKTEPSGFDLGGDSSLSIVAYNGASNDKHPIVLVLPEWWGLTEYPKNRARQFAEMGYFAMAVDLYGNGKIAGTPDSAGALAGAFYQDFGMAKTRIDAAMAKAKTYAQADSTKVILVGYCFGGGLALNAAKMGGDYTAVCSFHGSLKGVPAKKDATKARIFVAHGAADSNVPAADVAQFRQELDAAGTPYVFREYAGATHAFTNPDATATGKKFSMPIAYNAAADSASWKDMKQFLGDVLR